MATAILFNLGRMWGDDGPDEDESDSEDEDGCDNEIAGSETFTVVEGDAGSVRIRGQVERERILNNMK